MSYPYPDKIEVHNFPDMASAPNAADWFAEHGSAPFWVGGTQYVSNGTSISTIGGGSATVVTITGTAAVGSTLTATLGIGWTANSYQWMRDGVVIVGATNSTYVVQSGDANTEISCVVSNISNEATGVTIASVAATYPGLISHIRFNGNLTPDVGTLVLTGIAESTNTWATTGAMNLDPALGQQAEQSAPSGSTALALEVGKVFVVEVDVTLNDPAPTNTSGTSCILEISDVDTAACGGIRLMASALTTATAYMDFAVKCSSWPVRLDPTSTVKTLSTFPRGTRTHLVLVIDTTQLAATNNVYFATYANGAKLQSETKASAQTNHTGSFYVGATGKKNIIGNRHGTARQMEGDIYNARVWKLSSFPVNMDALVADLYANKDGTPTLWNGLS